MCRTVNEFQIIRERQEWGYSEMLNIGGDDDKTITKLYLKTLFFLLFTSRVLAMAS